MDCPAKKSDTIETKESKIPYIPSLWTYNNILGAFPSKFCPRVNGTC